MPFFGFLFFLIFAAFIGIYSIIYIYKYVRTREVVYLKKLGLTWVLPSALIVLGLYHHYPITKNRIVGHYEIDTNFYPGKNAEWQKELFSFEITENEFLFHEKLKDGSIKTSKGKVEWYRNSPPMLFRINMGKSHPLIDEYPALYRGNRKFYYVFESNFGNMFYRKVK